MVVTSGLDKGPVILLHCPRMLLDSFISSSHGEHNLYTRYISLQYEYKRKQINDKTFNSYQYDQNQD